MAFHMLVLGHGRQRRRQRRRRPEKSRAAMQPRRRLLLGKFLLLNCYLMQFTVLILMCNLIFNSRVISVSWQPGRRPHFQQKQPCQHGCVWRATTVSNFFENLYHVSLGRCLIFLCDTKLLWMFTWWIVHYLICLTSFFLFIHYTFAKQYTRLLIFYHVTTQPTKKTNAWIVV